MLGAQTHLVAAVLFVYALGVFRFHWSWALATLWALHHVDARRRAREHGCAHQAGRDAREKELRTQPAVRWLNKIVRVVWPQYEPGLAEYTRGKLQAALDGSLPEFIESLPIKRLTFGPSAPQLDAIRLMYARRLDSEGGVGVRAVRSRAVLDLDVRMDCAGEAVLVVRLGSRHVHVSVPVTLSDVCVRGRLRVELVFCTPWPFFARLHLAWAELPHVACSVRPVRSVDVMEMPGLSTWLQELIEGGVRRMVWPLRVCLPYEEWYGEEGARGVGGAAADEGGVAQLSLIHI